MPRLTPLPETLKRLFARSGNKCAYPGCNRLLFDKDQNFIAEVCHIEGAAPGGERFNAEQTDEQRRDITNLLVMCHEHHKVTDNVVAFTVDKLKQIKADHEAQYNSGEFIVTDVTLDKIVRSLASEFKPMLTSIHDMVQQLLKVNTPPPVNAPQELQKLIQKFQEDEPGVRVEARTTSEGTSYVIRPSKPNQPLTIAELSFPDTPMGRIGLQKFRTAIETGRDVEIHPEEHNWKPIINLPSALLENPPSALPLLVQQNSFLKKFSPQTPVNITWYLLGSSEEVVRFGFVRMKMLRIGTKEVEFQLAGGQLAADLIFAHSFDDKSTMISYELGPARVKPEYALQTLKVFEAFAQNTPLRFAITSLETDDLLLEGRLTTSTGSTSSLSLESIRFSMDLLKELSEVNRILGVNLRYPVAPDQYLGMEIMLVYGLATGRTMHGKPDGRPFPILLECQAGRRLLEAWKKGEIVNLPMPAPEYSIAGCFVNMPGTWVELCDTRPALSLESLERLLDSCGSPNEEISIEVDCKEYFHHPAKKD